VGCKEGNPPAVRDLPAWTLRRRRRRRRRRRMFERGRNLSWRVTKVANQLISRQCLLSDYSFQLALFTLRSCETFWP